ncbi:MAG: hypothetical protein KDJ75_09860, partial [Alphaproteobacteria bacterium]|nr:hypothetical protein [Alphaproteobacteria bacterium]
MVDTLLKPDEFSTFRIPADGGGSIVIDPRGHQRHEAAPSPDAPKPGVIEPKTDDQTPFGFWASRAEDLYNEIHGEGAWAERVEKEGLNAEQSARELSTFAVENGGYDFSILMEDDPSEEAVVASESWQRASEIVYDMKYGKGAWEKRAGELAKKGLSQEQIKEELGKAGITYMAEFNFQLYEMGKATYDLYNAKPEQQQALLYMMQVYEKKDWTWGTFGRALWKSVVDPVNLALMVGSAGTGFLAAKGIQAGVMKGLQTALTFGASAMVKEGAKTTATTAAKMTFRQRAAQAATSNLAFAGMGSGAIAGSVFGSIDADRRQHVQIAADFQDEYKISDTAIGGAMGAGMGGLFGWALPFAGGVGKAGIKGASSEFAKLADNLAWNPVEWLDTRPIRFDSNGNVVPGGRTSTTFGMNGGNAINDLIKQLSNEAKKLARKQQGKKFQEQHAQWAKNTADDEALLRNTKKTYDRFERTLQNQSWLDNAPEGRLRQKLGALEQDILKRGQKKQDLEFQLNELKELRKNLPEADALLDNFAELARERKDIKASRDALVKAGNASPDQLKDLDDTLISINTVIADAKKQIKTHAGHQKAIDNRIQAVTDHLHKLNEIETQQTALKGTLDTAAEAAKARAEAEAEKAATALPPPPEPSKTPAKEQAGMPSIKLPDMANEKDWIRIFAYMRVAFTGSIKQLFSPKADVNRSNKITRPVIDAVDTHLQDLGLVSKFVEKESKREPYFQAEQPITWLPLHLPKIIKKGTVEKGLIRELQDKVIAIAQKDGWADTEVKNAFIDFAKKNGTKLEHARANIRKLRAKVASDAYKPTRKFFGHGLNETHRQKLLNHLDHWDNTLDDLSKVSGGQNADEAIQTLRAIERKELQFYGNAKEPQDIRTLTLDTVDDTVYGLFRASFDENRSYIQHEGLWPKEVVEKRKVSKEPGMDSIHVSAQYRQLLEFEIQEGLYDDQRLSPKTIRASYLSLSTENFERLIQNDIIEFYTLRDENGGLKNVPGNKWESTAIQEYAGRLIQAKKKGWGSEALFAIEYLKRAKQLFGKGDLATIPEQEMIAQYLKSLPEYKEDPGFRIWAQAVINAHDKSSLPGRPNLLGWMLKENRFGWSAA